MTHGAAASVASAVALDSVSAMDAHPASAMTTAVSVEKCQPATLPQS